MGKADLHYPHPFLFRTGQLIGNSELLISTVNLNG